MTTWLVLAVLSASGNGRVQEPELWVELVDAASLGDAVVRNIHLEVERLYRPAGVAVVWKQRSPAESEAHTATVYLMDALPTCLRRRLRTFGGGRPMGIALGRIDETSGPIIYVSRQSVAESITGDDDKMARALGRVVAHELGHRFLQRTHTRRGLMKERLGRDDLVGSGDHLILEHEEALRVAAVALSSMEKR